MGVLLFIESLSKTLIFQRYAHQWRVARTHDVVLETEFIALAEAVHTSWEGTTTMAAEDGHLKVS
jgi:hypothetical protein